MIRKLYEVTFDSDVFAISLVDKPAIEKDFVFLSEQFEEQSKQVFLEENDKHLVIGPVLIPNKPIYRNQGGEEFYIRFSSDVIEKLAYDYLMNGRIYSTTTDHKDIADDVALVESWIKTSENDKSVELGIDVPIGTWIAAMKVENEDVWQRIKNGELKGFSIESFVNLEEIKLSKNMIENNLEQVDVNESFWTKLKDIIFKALGKTEETVEEVAEETVELAEETVEETVEEQVELSEETAKEVAEEVAATVEEEAATVEEEKEDLSKIIEELQAKIGELEESVAAKDVEIEELKKSNQLLSAQPSTKHINVNASKSEGSLTFLDYASGKIKLK